MIKSITFQTHLLRWFDKYGRKNLPWQQEKTPYRVWISEIMLQQTQVTTVVSYFTRFIQRFPNIYALADANEDEVLHLWTGLGYYSRARNLHKTAKQIVAQCQGDFPDNLCELQKLPGIGPSTAGAILALAFNQPQPILDGNVKRVLSRVCGIREPINEKKTEVKLWEQAKYFTPKKRTADYTQAIMDLGAMICTPHNPSCLVCPFKTDCIAYEHNLVKDVPNKIKKLPLPIKSATFIILLNQDCVMLQKRPAKGIWGGLWSFPELPGSVDEEKINYFCHERFGFTPKKLNILPFFRHSFTHYHLDIHPILIHFPPRMLKLMAPASEIWYNLGQQPKSTIGLPKPTLTILRSLPNVPSPMCKIKKTSRRVAATTPPWPVRQKDL